LPSSSTSRNFRAARSSIPVAQSQELLFALSRRRPRRTFKLIHRVGGDGAGNVGLVILHREQHDHPVEAVFPGVTIGESGGGSFWWLAWTANGVLPSLVTIILAVAGVSWQRSNIEKWTQMLSVDRDHGGARHTLRPNSDIE
jgi:hypothetical protein